MATRPSLHVKLGIAALVLVGVGIVAWRSARNYSGYCQEQGRKFSDEQKINAAIEYALQAYPPSIDIYEGSGATRKNIGNERPPDPIPYENIDDFKRVNPNCCSIVEEGQHGYRIEFLERIDGSRSVLARLTYLVRYKDKQGNSASQPVQETYAVSNCARLSFGR